MSVVGRASRWRPALVGLVGAAALLGGLSAPARAYLTNGKHWDSLPVRVYVNPAGAPDFSPLTLEDVIQQSLDAWNSVGCSNFQFIYAGETDARGEVDGLNVIYWVDDPAQWMAADQAAGATLHHPAVPDPETVEVDLALNGFAFQWVVGGADALTTDVLDPASVITHELGHWLGLGHSEDQFATMYYAHLPGTMQATLEADDKNGLCTLYPAEGTPDECETDADCDVPEELGGAPVPGTGRCVHYADWAVCGDRHAAVGEACSVDDLNCDDICFVSFFECSTMCFFPAALEEGGYCAPLCKDPNGVESPCPPGWTCTEFEQYGISVCWQAPEEPDGDPEVAPEAGPEPGAEAGPELSAEPVSELVGVEDVTADAGSTQPETTQDVVAASPDAGTAQPAETSGGCSLAGASTRAGGLVALLGALVLLGVLRRRGYQP